MTDYYIADSFKNYELIDEPYRNKAGKLATKARCKCDRCVNGVYAAGVENGQIKPHPAYNGVCLKCGGTGFITKEIRLYTKAEYDALQRNKERAAAKREETMLANADKKRNDWLEANGFDSEGYTYILVGINSYTVKDQLKAEGWKYNSFLRWHTSEIEGSEYADNVEKVHWSEFYSTTVWGDMHPLPDAQKKADILINGEKEPSHSEWIGEVGGKIKELPVTLKGIYGFQGRYGYSQVVKFEDECGNVLTWFTAVNIPIEVGEKCKLSGTIKKHDQYKEEKTTILTRCKLN